MKKLLMIVMVAGSAFLISNVANAATWGNEDYHVQMDRDHQHIAPYMNHENARIRSCAHAASRALNGNDWHAARGWWNVAAWNARKEIMKNFGHCYYRAVKLTERRKQLGLE